LMKTLSIAGTAAMFLVGGGIITHSVPALHHFIQGLATGTTGSVVAFFADFVVGLLIGVVVLGVVEIAKRAWKRKPAAAV
jgi:uncharacterized protein